MDSRQLLAEALRLSEEERAALAGELIQSLEGEVDPDAEAAWTAEIRARLERVDAGKAKSISWSEATRRYLLRRYPFSVVYRIEPRRILICHAHRRPRYWESRQ